MSTNSTSYVAQMGDSPLPVETLFYFRLKPFSILICNISLQKSEYVWDPRLYSSKDKSIHDYHDDHDQDNHDGHDVHGDHEDQLSIVTLVTMMT